MLDLTNPTPRDPAAENAQLINLLRVSLEVMTLTQIRTVRKRWRGHCAYFEKAKSPPLSRGG